MFGSNLNQKAPSFLITSQTGAPSSTTDAVHLVDYPTAGTLFSSGGSRSLAHVQLTPLDYNREVMTQDLAVVHNSSTPGITITRYGLLVRPSSPIDYEVTIALPRFDGTSLTLSKSAVFNKGHDDAYWRNGRRLSASMNAFFSPVSTFKGIYFATVASVGSQAGGEHRILMYRSVDYIDGIEWREGGANNAGWEEIQLPISTTNHSRASNVVDDGDGNLVVFHVYREVGTGAYVLHKHYLHNKTSTACSLDVEFLPPEALIRYSGDFPVFTLSNGDLMLILSYNNVYTSSDHGVNWTRLTDIDLGLPSHDWDGPNDGTLTANIRHVIYRDDAPKLGALRFAYQSGGGYFTEYYVGINRDGSLTPVTVNFFASTVAPMPTNFVFNKWVTNSLETTDDPFLGGNPYSGTLPSWQDIGGLSVEGNIPSPLTPWRPS